MSTENRPPPFIFTDEMDPGPQPEPTPQNLFARIRATLMSLHPKPHIDPAKKTKQEAVWKK